MNVEDTLYPPAPRTAREKLAQFCGWPWRITDEERRALAPEGILHFETGVRVQQKIIGRLLNKRTRTRNTLVITEQRFALYGGGRRIVDVAFADPGFSRVSAALDEKGRVVVTVPPGVGRTIYRTSTLTLSMATTDPNGVLALLRTKSSDVRRQTSVT